VVRDDCWWKFVTVLVVMAHYDVDRVLRDHTLRSVAAYAAAADRTVLVSTSGLDEASLARLPEKVELVTRPNYGYDFFSYKWGLDHVVDYPDYDRILIVNDSFIGPTVPVETIIGSENARSVDLMGMTLSPNHGSHAQSFFFTVGSRLARSHAFRSFWQDMVPVSDRSQVIMRYEVGLSRMVQEAGFTVGGYLRPTEHEEQLARRRMLHFGRVRLHNRRIDEVVSEVFWADDRPRRYNPAVALADRVLVDDRLPLVKFDTLRYDPYELGADVLLRQCETAMPETFDGVRDFLRSTRLRYPFREGETNIVTSPRALREARLGYCMDDAFLAGRGADL